MKLKRLTHEGVKFYARTGTSDEKTFKEVLVKNTYEKKYFKIEEGEHWIDLGGNVGAFALNAIRKGATVEVYEPDPFNCKMIERNLVGNGYEADVFQKAVVANDVKEMTMYVGNNMQVWRNSLYRNWGNQSFKVPCVHFSEVIKKDSCVKMDIEGAEMDILENMEVFPRKMVFEWSFDIDNDLNRYRAMVEKLKEIYPNVYAPSYNEQYTVWPESWFPPCANVYCYE